MLEEFAPSLYILDGPVVSFFGFPYPTRMAVVRLQDGGLWVWSPVALNEALKNAVEAIGAVQHIVSPNKIHHLFLAEWANRWPDARLYAPPGLITKKPELKFDTELRDTPESAWEQDIDQVVFRGSILMEEVEFFHRESRTAIIGDMVQRHPEKDMKGWKGRIMRFDGLVGTNGSTPREWRASFLRRGLTRKARDKLIAWKADNLVIAHGECVKTKANEVLAKALDWI